MQTKEQTVIVMRYGIDLESNNSNIIEKPQATLTQISEKLEVTRIALLSI